MGTYPYTDEKHRERHLKAVKKYDTKHRERKAEYRRQKYREFREWIDGFKNQPCADCGIEYPPRVMDFHHRNQEEKSFDPGQKARMSRESLKKEIDKCDVICSNCHRLHHH